MLEEASPLKHDGRLPESIEFDRISEFDLLI